MVEDMTTLLGGIITSIKTLIEPGRADTAVAYVSLLAIPVLGGIVAFARRLVKKAKN